jgi:hypothetical protein
MTIDTRHRIRFPLLALASSALIGSVTAAVMPGQQATPQTHSHHMGAEPPGCSEATLECAIAATPTFSADGTLWLAWAAGGQVSVAKSTDGGHRLSPPVAVTPKPVTLDVGADERPQIIVDHDGRVLVAYAIFKDAKFNGQILTAVSKDGGASFSTPRSITADGSSQRFINLALDQDGKIFASWIDKRNVAAAQKAGQPFAGASLAFAWSSDGGSTFSAARIAHDHMCECCRLGVALAAPHRPAVLFRDIFDGERDHAVLTFTADLTPGPVSRVAEDHWKLDACPHHGPSLTIARDGAYHAVWFSGGGVRQGTFYARSRDGGRTFSEPLRIGSAERQPMRPYVHALGGALWLAWKEFDGERTTVLVQMSRDAGATWSTPRVVAETRDFSDHPLLVDDGHQVYVSWLTRIEGYRLMPLMERS